MLVLELRMYGVGPRTGALGPCPDSIQFSEHKNSPKLLDTHTFTHTLILQGLFPGGNTPLKGTVRTIRYMDSRKLG